MFKAGEITLSLNLHQCIPMKFFSQKKKNVADLGNSLVEMFEYGPGNPIILWKPVIEPDFGQERFLVEDPTISFQKGNFMRIPVMAGIAKYEFLHPAISKFIFTSLVDRNAKALKYMCYSCDT